MDAGLLVRGLAIGFAVAVALGPIGLLVIRRTIEGGWAEGLASGVGVATADAIYGAVAAFGLTAVRDLLVGIDRPLGIVGGVILLVLAARALRLVDRSHPASPELEAGRRIRGPVQAWGSMVVLTLANPMTILSFAALFAGIGSSTHGFAGAAVLVGGVFLGSAAWWALLTGLVAGLRARMTPRIIRGLNVASAVLIGGFGVVAVALGLAA